MTAIVCAIWAVAGLCVARRLWRGIAKPELWMPFAAAAMGPLLWVLSRLVGLEAWLHRRAARRAGFRTVLSPRETRTLSRELEEANRVMRGDDDGE